MVRRVWRAFWFAFWSAMKQEATRRVPDQTLTIQVKADTTNVSAALAEIMRQIHQVKREFR